MCWKVLNAPIMFRFYDRFYVWGQIEPNCLNIHNYSNKKLDPLVFALPNDLPFIQKYERSVRNIEFISFHDIILQPRVR